MSTLTAKIPANGVLNVSLRPDTQRLDEVVVTGYGNFSKSSFTGSANTLRGDLLKNVPVVSVEQKLQGMTPGVSISGNSGQPGANQVYVFAVWGHSMHRKNLCLSLTEHSRCYILLQFGPEFHRKRFFSEGCRFFCNLWFSVLLLWLFLLQRPKTVKGGDVKVTYDGTVSMKIATYTPKVLSRNGMLV